MIKRPLEANRELFISLDSATCPCIKVARIPFILNVSSRLNYDRAFVPSFILSVLWCVCVYVCLRMCDTNNVSREFNCVIIWAWEVSTLIRNIWNNRLEYIASEFVTSPIYPRLFSSFPPLIDRLSGRRMLSRSLHESLCCGKIHWQIASWKGNGVFEQPFDDSLFTWYPFIPRFVPINRDTNVQSPFHYLIFDIKLRFMRSILYKSFSRHVHSKLITYCIQVPIEI